MSGLIKTHQENLALTNNWLMDCQHGKVKGWTARSEYGVNPSVGTSLEDIWSAGATRTWLTAAATMEAISDSANDTAAGTGARTIVIEGLDANWDEVSETVTMAGTSASTATTATFIRVNRAYVATVGTYGLSNIGNITIRVSSAGSTQGYILATEGATGNVCISVADGKEIDIHELHISSDSTKEVDFRVQVRENADDSTVPCSPWKTKAFYARLVGLTDISLLVPLRIPGKSDFRIQAVVPGTDTAYCTSEIKYSMHDTRFE